MIVNQKTADQIHATMTALQATLKATQQHDGDVLSDTRKGPTAELTQTMASVPVADRRASTAPSATRRSPGRSAAPTRSPATSRR